MFSFGFLEKCKELYFPKEKNNHHVATLGQKRFCLHFWYYLLVFNSCNFFFQQMRAVHQNSRPKRCYQSEQPSEQIFVSLLLNEMFYRKVEVVRNR